MRYFITSIIVLVLFSCFLSCEEKDNFSSDPNLSISFSTDTLRFDTVFTTLGSATRRLLVHNKNNNSLTIQSVELMNPEKSGFRMNVDGVGGNVVTDVDILKKDSVYLFIEVTVDPQNSNSPMLIRDSIRFSVNGKYQYLQLEAFGQDVHLWKGKTFANDSTLTGEKPFLVYDSLVVEKGATLNLQQNVRMFFHSGAKALIYGSINARGSIDQPVVMRGDRTDNLFSNVPYDRVPGQWEGLFIDSLSFNNHFEHFHLRNSMNGILFKPSNLSASKAVFKNAMIHNTKLDGVRAQNCRIKGENSIFSNAGGSVMKLIGGDYEFLHCTFANYMSWRGLRKNKALIIGNITDEKQPMPLNKCSFTNSIIAGSSSSEIRIQRSENTSDIPFQHLFTSCLIKENGTDDDNFVNTIWKEDPKFKNINNDKDYYYNFRLDSVSPVINKANLSKAMALPLDIVGNSRLSDEGPDIGCYEWIKSGN